MRESEIESESGRMGSMGDAVGSGRCSEYERALVCAGLAGDLCASGDLLGVGGWVARVGGVCWQ